MREWETSLLQEVQEGNSVSYVLLYQWSEQMGPRG